jgi:hypothetical protein
MHDLVNLCMQHAGFHKVPNTLNFLAFFLCLRDIRKQKKPRVLRSGAVLDLSVYVAEPVQPFGT